MRQPTKGTAKKIGVGVGVKKPIKINAKTTVGGKIIDGIRDAAKDVGFVDGYRPTPANFVRAMKQTGFDTGSRPAPKKAAPKKTSAVKKAAQSKAQARKK